VPGWLYSVRDLDFKRSDRLGEVIKEEISLILLDGIKDPQIGLVTITRVKMNDDLKSAKVYYTVFGDEIEKNKCQEGLNRAKGYIKRVIGERLKIKYIPSLVFIFDDSLDYGNRIESLLDDLKSENERG
jgi:ribosome-binding factor A